jgi:hypothetical protein
MPSIYMSDYVELPVGGNSSGSDVEFEVWPFAMLPEIISLNRTVHEVGRPIADSDVC